MKRKAGREVGSCSGSLRPSCSIRSCSCTTRSQRVWFTTSTSEPPKERKKRRPSFFASPENRKAFLESLGQELGIKQLSDWYKITPEELCSYGGEALFKDHASMENMLKELYPDYHWPSMVETERAKLLNALDRAEKYIGITAPEDWYSINLTDLHEVGFSTSITRIQLAELLKEKYPQQEWDTVCLLRGKYAQQKRAEKAVRALFPGLEVKINVKKEVGLINPVTGDYLELDIYVTGINLAFEYQETHHYTEKEAFGFHSLKATQEKDLLKRSLAKEKGITIITIPFWWDGKTESLVATIRKARPELLTDYPLGDASEIPQEIPAALKRNVGPPDIGEPINAKFMTFTSVDPTNWWIFEKYDGVRGLWNPLKKAMYSRQGNVMRLPEEILRSMPEDTFLDGELWFGRENFQETQNLAIRNVADADWSRFKYMVFDIPKHNGTYAERYNQLAKVVNEKQSKYIEVAPFEVCKGMSHLETVFQDLVDKGGEGIILRDPIALYESGRSKGYLKHKRFRDAEAKVVAFKGHFQYECELPNGVRFTAVAGTKEFAKRYSADENNKGLKVGDIVSFKHRGFLLGSKKPKVATLYRVRHDLTWEDVLRNWKEQKPTFTASPIRRPKKRVMKKHYWLQQENRRKFFVDFAQEMGFDPLDIKCWASITAKQIKEKKGNSILAHFGGSLKKALVSSFPEFASKEPGWALRGYWGNTENQRNFFAEIAADHGFDPYDIEKWGSLPLNRLVLNKKGGKAILNYYHGSCYQALHALFVEPT